MNKRRLFADKELFSPPGRSGSVKLFTSSIAVPSSSFFNKHEYAILSRPFSPQSRFCLDDFWDCGEFSFDFVDNEANVVCQLLFALKMEKCDCTN